MNDYNFECCYVTYGDKGTPHLEHLLEMNPGLVVHTHTAPHAPGMWRRGDVNIRNWIRSRPSLPKRVLFMDYDVRVNIDLSHTFDTKLASVECAYLFHEVLRNGPAFFAAGMLRIPEDFRQFATGITPLGVLLMDDAAMHAITSEQYDEVFDTNVFSECRLGTVIKHAGLTLDANPIFHDCRNYTHQIVSLSSPFVHPVRTSNAL